MAVAEYYVEPSPSGWSVRYLDTVVIVARTRRKAVAHALHLARATSRSLREPALLKVMVSDGVMLSTLITHDEAQPRSPNIDARHNIVALARPHPD